jgi:hypothetical protein
MNGIVWELHAALDPRSQAIVDIIAGGFVLAAAVSLAVWRLRADRATAEDRIRAEFAPTIAWLDGHQASWPMTREERSARRAQWHQMDQKPATPGRHRQPEQRTPEEAVDQAFAAAFGSRQTVPAPAAAPVAVGKAAVAQDLESLIAAINAVCELAPMEAAANSVDTALIPAVTSDGDGVR